VKLSSKGRSSSFFESFSDLIFATMAIFVLLLIIVLTQVNPPTEEEESFRFSGASGQTYSLIAHAMVADVPSVIFFPVEVAERLQMMRGDFNDPLLMLSEIAASSDGLASIPISEYVKIASANGISAAFARRIRSQGEGTVEASLLLAAANSQENVTGADLKALVFGKDVYASLAPAGSDERLQLQPAYRPAYRAAVSWLQTHQKGDFHSWIARSRTPVRQAAVEAPGDIAAIHVRISGRNINVGDARFSASAFRGFLRSVRPGADFSLSVVDPSGEAIPPPDWFYDEVLQPTGFTAVLPPP
jgi:hypothetical protein